MLFHPLVVPKAYPALRLEILAAAAAATAAGIYEK